MFRFFYELGIHLLASISFPFLLYKALTEGKYRRSFPCRLGLGFPKIQKGDRECFWVHAVSVGETKAIAPFVKCLRQKHPEALIVFSNITETGHAEAIRSVPHADHHVYLPFDFSYIVRPLLKKLRPDHVFLCETDFWFNFLKAAKDFGAHISLLNGKLSERSLKRFSKVSFFSKHLLSLPDQFFVQSPLHKKRFEKVGVCKEKISAMGNFKLDSEVIPLCDQEREQWKKTFALQEGEFVLTLGSTHAPEEEILFKELKKVWKTYPSLKVLLAPRHPERCPQIKELMKKEGIPFIPYSKMEEKTGNEWVVLIDCIGLLRTCYQLSDVAVVAGSYTEKVGGHNILEPCFYGVPAICGPHMHSQLDFLDLFKEYSVGWQVPKESFAEKVRELLASSEKRREMGQRGLQAVESGKGATKRTYEKIFWN